MTTAHARLARLLLAVLLLALALPGAHARREAPSAPDVALASLPAQARETHALILRGGPFPNERDGVVFGNRERLLPSMPRGYYHEYTVRTPGARNRGARRIVCGGAKRDPEVCYYTDDHYQSFRRIRP
jgi:ribonuclease T1